MRAAQKQSSKCTQVSLDCKNPPKGLTREQGLGTSKPETDTKSLK